MGNKMKEWFEANQEIYAEFKSKIHSTLDILSQDGTNVAECDETYSLQNMLLEAMAAKNMPVENIINTFSKAAEEGDMAACWRGASIRAGAAWIMMKGGESMDFGIAGVAAITVICYLAGQLVKASGLDNKWIPIICGVVGGILGVLAMRYMPDYPAGDYITAVAVGIVSGFAATGINEAVKQIKQ